MSEVDGEALEREFADVVGAKLVAERIRQAVAEVRLNDLEGNPVR